MIADVVEVMNGELLILHETSKVDFSCDMPMFLPLLALKDVNVEDTNLLTSLI